MLNPNSVEYLALRNCLREPIPELADAAQTLSDAVELHLLGKREEAADLIASTNTDLVRGYIESLWGSKKDNPDQVHYLRLRKVESLPEKRAKAKDRMPGDARKRALIERDGYICRYCGMQLIPAGVRDVLRKHYPDALPWGRTNLSQHAAFQALWLQYDHVLPACYGGDSSLENMVVCCAGCNFGKGSKHLEELGLTDPRDRAPVPSDWVGLTNIGSGTYV